VKPPYSFGIVPVELVEMFKPKFKKI